MVRLKRFSLSVVMIAAAPAWGGLVNGGFESQYFTGWSVSKTLGGLAQHLSSSGKLSETGVWEETEGNLFARLHNGGGAAGASAQISQSFSLSSAAMLSFDVFFDEGSGTDNDTAQAMLWNGSTWTTLWFREADVVLNSTPWEPISYGLGPGNYTLEFAIFQDESGQYPSMMGVDNITLNEDLQIIPAPAAIVLGAIGLGTMAMRRWR